MQILLVEDHADTALAMSRLLQFDGHSVAVAGTVRAALQWAEDKSLDLLICDLGLPDGSGLDLLQSLRKTHRFPGVCLTGVDGQERIEQIHAAGFDAYLTKPIDFAKLESLIGGLVGKSLAGKI